MTNFPVAEPDSLAPYLAEAEAYCRRAKAENTLRAYRSDWASFDAFCRDRGVPCLPALPSTVAAYAAQAARSLKANTIERRLTAISQVHQFSGLSNPVEDKLVSTVMAGIRRVKGTAQEGKEPLCPAVLRRMFVDCPDDLRAVRDRALVLVGFAGAFRRSELVGLRLDQVRFTAEGLVVTIPRSKTDPEGEGQTIGIPYGHRLETCPVRALEVWLKRSGICDGYLFRAIGRWADRPLARPICDHQLAKIIKRLAASAGLDPSVYSGHSLRSGLATAAAAGGASERSVMEQTRHRSLRQVRKYIRRGSLFVDNAAALAGL